MAYSKKKTYNFATGKKAWSKIKDKLKKMKGILKSDLKYTVNANELAIKAMGPCKLDVDINWRNSRGGLVRIIITPDEGDPVAIVDETFKLPDKIAKKIDEDYENLQGFLDLLDPGS